MEEFQDQGARDDFSRALSCLFCTPSDHQPAQFSRGQARQRGPGWEPGGRGPSRCLPSSSVRWVTTGGRSPGPGPHLWL